jgi:tungstate transport system substrate-binding protein
MIRIALLLLSLVAAGSTRAEEPAAGAAHADEFAMTLGVSKSTQLSGLLDNILPEFKTASNVAVRVIAIEHGQEAATAKDSGANAFLLDDRAAEDQIMADGLGIERRGAIYSDAVIVGPKSDPAGVRGMKAAEAFAQIAAKRAVFVGRSDDSDIGRLERRIWKAAGTEPDQSAPWYRDAKADMAATLAVAAAVEAYTVTDRAAWASFANRKDLEILNDGDPMLFDVFTSIVVNPEKQPRTKFSLARIWHGWLTDKHGLAAINAYTVSDSQIFFPCQGDAVAACRSAARK